MKNPNEMEPGPSISLPPPAFAGVPEYGASLSEVAFWTPYVAAVLARHGLPAASPEVGEPGSFPTFLAGGYAVKFFGELFEGARSFTVERSLHRLFLLHPDVPAPTLVAEGRLFEQGWSWPYLITTRLDATPWRDAMLTPAEQAVVTRQLGRAMRRVHELPPPAGAVWARDALAELRPGCVARHRRWGTLPPHLIDQIDGYLIQPSPLRHLLHADLHEDHIFVEGGQLAGVIDWGDAIVADPYYELPALHLGTFRGDTALLHHFLAGYGWDVAPDFAHRAMSMTLLHEFDVLSAMRGRLDLGAFPSLDVLAGRLWDLPLR
jgi:aminoglycoside phosphotransferase